MTAAAPAGGGRLEELRAAWLEAYKRRAELERWASATPGTVAEGIGLAAHYLGHGRFGPLQVCPHLRRKDQRCDVCDAEIRRASAAATEEEGLALAADYRRTLLEDLARWVKVYRSSPSDPDYGRAIAEGLELARVYMLTGRLELEGWGR